MNDTVETLKKARANLVIIRQQWAEVLAKPFERGKTENAITRIVELQNAIAAVDAAIAEQTNPRATVL